MVTLSQGLDWRERSVLKAFEEKPTLKFHHLPQYVGRITMARLVAKGLAEVVNPAVGQYSKNYQWRRIP